MFFWFFANVAKLVKFNLFEFSHVLELSFPCCVLVLLFGTWLLCTIGPFNTSLLCIPNGFWNLLVVWSLFFSTPPCYVFLVFDASLPCTFNLFNHLLLCVFGVFHILLIMCSWCFLMPFYFMFLIFLALPCCALLVFFGDVFYVILMFFNAFLLHAARSALWHLFVTLS